MLGEKHPDYVTSLRGLALTYAKQKEFAKATEAFERRLADTKELYNAPHSEIAGRLHDVAWVYNQTGNPLKALGFYKQELEMRRAVAGEESEEVAAAYTAVARTHQELKQGQEALAGYQKALAILHKIRRPDDPVIAETLDLIAGVFYDKKDYVESAK